MFFLFDILEFWFLINEKPKTKVMHSFDMLAMLLLWCLSIVHSFHPHLKRNIIITTATILIIIMIYYTILYYTKLYYRILYYYILYLLYYTVLYYTIL